MTGFRLSPRTCRFLLWTARVAFLAYFVQIIAVDHWHKQPADIYGLEGTSAHVAHCHGGGDCSDSGALVNPGPSGAATLPLPPPSLAVLAAQTPDVPDAAFTETPLRPPRAA